MRSATPFVHAALSSVEAGQLRVAGTEGPDTSSPDSAGEAPLYLGGHE